MDVESALQALSDPSGPFEEAAVFLALTPLRDARIAPALRRWLEEWISVHGQPTPPFGKFVTDEVTGLLRLAESPQHTQPAPCLLALGAHGSASDDALLARFNKLPASIMARCRLHGRLAPVPLALQALELFGKRGEILAGGACAAFRELRYWVDLLLSVAPAAPLQISSALQELLPGQAATRNPATGAGDGSRLDSEQIARVACLVIETTLPLEPPEAVPATAPGRIVFMVSKAFRDSGIPEDVASSLRARGLPATASDFEAWIRAHPGSLARERLAERLSELASRPAPACRDRGAMCYTPAGPTDRCEYLCPRCHAKTIYVRTGSMDAAVTSIRPPEEVRFQSSLPEEIVECRRIMGTLGEPWLTLDESQFCKRCSPDVRLARLRLIVRYGDEAKPHVTGGVSVADLQLIQAFLRGSPIHRNSDGDESPLRDHIKRLRTLLGVQIFP